MTGLAFVLAACGTTDASLELMVKNDRHQAAELEVVGQPPVILADCSAIVLKLPADAEWTLLVDGRPAYSNAELRVSGVSTRANTYPVVFLQGGIEPVLVLEERGSPELHVIDACRQRAG